MGAQVNNRALIGALPLIAQHLGRQYGVKVKFGHYETAMTDGETIYMPHLPVDDETTGVLANGFIDHESAHILETDFSIRPKTGLEKHMLNTLEDLRIELALIKRYPGTKRNLHKLVDLLVEKGDFFQLPDSQSPVNVLLSTALICGRCDVLEQQALADLATQAEKQFTEQLGSGALTRLRALLQEARSLKSTGEALKLTRKILKMLKEEQQKQQQQADQSQSDQQQQQQDGDSSSQDNAQSGHQQDCDAGEDQGDGGGDSDGDCGDQTGAATGDDAGDDTENADSKSDTDSGDAGVSGDSDTAETTSSASDGAGGDTSPEQLAEALRKALEAGEGEIENHDMGQAIAEELRQDLDENHRHDCVDLHSLNQHEDELFQSSGYAPVDPKEVSKVTLRLRSRLQASLETALRERKTVTDTGRRIHQGRLSRIAVGDGRIFQHKQKKSGLDTAIQLLVDRSGSMGGHRIHVAMNSAMALMQSLEGIKGVSTAAAVFPYHVTLTGFEEKLPMTQHRYEPAAMGGTPLTEALLWSVKHHLSGRREKRKILIVLTDGAPNDQDSARAVIKKAQRHDIEVIGVGIELPMVRDLFDTATVIDDVNELPNRLFELIHRKLI